MDISNEFSSIHTWHHDICNYQIGHKASELGSCVDTILCSHYPHSGHFSLNNPDYGFAHLFFIFHNEYFTLAAYLNRSFNFMHPLLDHPLNIFSLKGLRKIVIHADSKKLLSISFHCIGGQSDNRYMVEWLSGRVSPLPLRSRRDLRYASTSFQFPVSKTMTNG